MPAPEVAWLSDWALLWPATGIDDDGEVTISSATGTPIRARWIDRRAESLDRKGATIALDGLADVDRDIPEGSILWLGTQAEWAALNPPGESDRIRQAITINTIPDVKGRSQRRTVGLMKFRDRLPAVVA